MLVTLYYEAPYVQQGVVNLLRDVVLAKGVLERHEEGVLGVDHVEARGGLDAAEDLGRERRVEAGAALGGAAAAEDGNPGGGNGQKKSAFKVHSCHESTKQGLCGFQERSY